jgi:methionyl-tRNA formyltransferase
MTSPDPESVRWAFLMLEDHPYGRQMLSRLLEAGFCPRAVIEERSEVAEVERDKFARRMAGFSLAPSVDALLAGRAVSRTFVPSHNAEACAEALAAWPLDLLVLGGTRILQPHIFTPAPALNSHPGLLPQVRGSASVAWAIHLDERVGCTCHFIEAGIDTGPIVGRRELVVHRGDTYEKLCHATTVLAAELMVEALQAFARGELRGVPQPPGGVAHRNMPEDMVDGVRRKLAEGRYAHLVD